MKHKHEHCEHDVRWCKDCDVIFCLRCDAEWKPPCKQLHYPLFGSPTYLPWTFGVGSDTITSNLDASVPANRAPPEPVTVCAHGR